MGIALSGGCDSMALALLCSKFESPDGSPLVFHAFIVDHKLRDESTKEARITYEAASRLKNIKPEILTLNWGRAGPPKRTSLETRARQYRRGALSKACKNLAIEDLLTGHHADDAVETILIRLYTGYTGPGLHGMRDLDQTTRLRKLKAHEEQSRSLTEESSCELDDAPSPFHKSRALALRKPLLQFDKTDLIGLCLDNNLAWIEDESNQDKTLTVRNAIRHLMATNVLPKALKGPSIAHLSAHWQKIVDRLEKVSTMMFSACEIRFMFGTGTIRVRLSEKHLLSSSVIGLLESPQEVIYCIAMLCRRLAELVTMSTPKGIDLENMAAAAGLVFPDLLQSRNALHEKRIQTSIEINSTIWNIVDRQGTGQVDFTVARAPPTLVRLEQIVKVLYAPAHVQADGTPVQGVPPISDLTAFDGRYLIRLRSNLDGPSGSFKVVMRFLTSDILATERRRDPEGPDNAALTRLLKEHAPGKSRYTIPAILTEPLSSDGEGARLVCLPSIGWTTSSRWGRDWTVDITFRPIDLQQTNRHSVVWPAGVRSTGKSLTDETASALT